MQMRLHARVEIAALLTALIAHPVLAQHHPWTDDVNAARRALVAGDIAAADRLITAARLEADRAGVADPDLARAMAMLADRWHRQSRAIRAESLYVAALALDERALGADHERVGATLAALGQLRLQAGDYDSAAVLYERAMPIFRRAYGAADAVTATLTNNLALAHENAGRLETAESLYVRALAEKEAALGAADPALVPALGNLGAVYRRRGDYAAAESLYVHALDVLDRSGAPAIASRLSVLANLAQTRERLGRVDDAVAAYEQAIAVYAESGAQRDRTFAILARNLGTLLIVQNRLTDAEHWLEEALWAAEAEYGPDHVEYARVLQPYARLLSLTDRPELARAMGKRARAILGEDAAAADPPVRAQANPSPAGAAPAAPLIPEPGRIYGEKEQINGRYVLTTWPKQISCPRYDPAKRPNRARIADRYETGRDIERMPARIQALLEVVIGLDGIPERKLTKVLRTSDPRFDEDLISWVQSCRFQPGKIGAEAVRVRIEFPLTMDFVR